jgi:hypothetical protein
MGVLDSSNDGGGWVNITAIEGAVTNLRSKYWDFGGVCGWEYFDAGATDGYAQPWQWLQQISGAIWAPVRPGWLPPFLTPPLPVGVKRLMQSGMGQIAAARAFRLSQGQAGA